MTKAEKIERAVAALRNLLEIELENIDTLGYRINLNQGVLTSIENLKTGKHYPVKSLLGMGKRRAVLGSCQPPLNLRRSDA